jgi:hypothetical protein
MFIKKSIKSTNKLLENEKASHPSSPSMALRKTVEVKALESPACPKAALAGELASASFGSPNRADWC